MYCDRRKQSTKPMRHFSVRWAVFALTFFLLEMNDMSNHAVSFENAKIGATPEGWTATLTGSGDPKWTVESDRTAPSKLTVLRQSGQATYPLILKNDTNIRDGFVEMKFKAIAGSEDRAAGIVWRATDANNYYVVRCASTSQARASACRSTASNYLRWKIRRLPRPAKWAYGPRLTASHCLTE